EGGGGDPDGLVDHLSLLTWYLGAPFGSGRWRSTPRAVDRHRSVYGGSGESCGIAGRAQSAALEEPQGGSQRCAGPPRTVDSPPGISAAGHCGAGKRGGEKGCHLWRLSPTLNRSS